MYKCVCVYIYGCMNVITCISVYECNNDDQRKRYYNFQREEEMGEVHQRAPRMVGEKKGSRKINVILFQLKHGLEMRAI